jgi:hypothetical protein
MVEVKTHRDHPSSMEQRIRNRLSGAEEVMGDETYQQRYHKRAQQEHAEFDNNPTARAQAELDFYWQCRLDAEAALREAAEWHDSTGFLERRRPSCHRARRDSDWYLR